MITLAVVPLLVGLAAAVGIPPIVGRIRPASATVLLTGLSLTVSLTTGVVLSLAAYVASHEIFPRASSSPATVDLLRDNVPLPPAVGCVAGGLALSLLVCAGVQLSRLAVSWRQIAVSSRGLPSAGRLTVIRDETPQAYAMPGRHHRVVVSTGMLRVLTGPQRAALLAHEEAHLRRHHYAYVQLAWLAAAANPLMRPIARAVDSCVERWADEDAARVVGDRRTVARALAAAATAARPEVAAGGLPAAHGSVVERVRLLLDPPSRYLRLNALLAGGAVLCCASVALVTLQVRGVVELAEAAAH